MTDIHIFDFTCSFRSIFLALDELTVLQASAVAALAPQFVRLHVLLRQGRQKWVYEVIDLGQLPICLPLLED